MPPVLIVCCNALMAKKTLVVLTDDIDGTEIKSGKGETVTFALDGQTYEIDLTNKNADALRKALAPYIAAGTRQTGAKRAKTTGTKPAEIRAWAQQQGLDVPARGRIPDSVREAWEAK